MESRNKGFSFEKVMIVHGLGLSSFSFRIVLDFLGSNGIHVVVFDLLGNGFFDKSVKVLVELENGFFERKKKMMMMMMIMMMRIWL